MTVSLIRAKPDEAKPGEDATVSVGAASPAASVEGAPQSAAANVDPKAGEPASAASATSGQPAADVKPPYPPPAAKPTQEGPLGVRFDFNSGCRAIFPESEHPWRVRLSDLDTGNVIFETNFKGGAINSTKRYYIRFRFEVWQQDKLVLSHDYQAKDREILVQFPIGTLGDTMGWFPYAAKFHEKHGCKLTCAMAEKLIPLFEKTYPDIAFVGHEGLDVERFYATYSMGLFFDDKDCVFQPCDFRYVGLHRTAGYILGVDPTEQPPRLSYTDDSRPIAEPYVCIAAQSTPSTGTIPTAGG
jgi:autotransporter strand-loop-strand O-heptosyltransferase